MTKLNIKNLMADELKERSFFHWLHIAQIDWIQPGINLNFINIPFDEDAKRILKKFPEIYEMI